VSEGHYTGDCSNGGGFIIETKADWLYVNYVAREQFIVITVHLRMTDTEECRFFAI
jgi:hypothetical protein